MHIITQSVIYYMPPLLQIQEPSKSQQHNKNTKTNGTTIGIDFGTTNSLSCFVSNENAYLATEEEGTIQASITECKENKRATRNDSQDPTDYKAAIIPSAISINKNGIQHIGKQALMQQSKPDYIVIKSIKRILANGKQQTLANLPNEAKLVIDKETQLPSIMAFGKIYTCCDIISAILHHIKTISEKSFAKFSIQQCKSVVITVPAYFNENARRLIKLSAESINLQVLRIINEPTAAALAYNLQHKQVGKYAVYDLGGGTFDLSILHFHKGILQVLSTGGNNNLGGDDLDDRINNTIQLKYPQTKTIDKSQIVSLSKQIKHHLSTHKQYTKAIKGICTINISRTEYENSILDLVNETIQITKETINNANLTPQNIDGIIMVGGSTRNKIIQQKLASIFPCPILSYINPDISVALGAGIQAAILDRRMEKQLLIDINPLSIGIETVNDTVEKIIHRNTPIPAKASSQFTTSKNNQTGIKINVLQGEREIASQCNYIGQFSLDNIPPMMAGQPVINVSFLLDVDGILTVTASEERSGISKEITVNTTHNLNTDTIKNNIMNAIKHRENDIRQKHYSHIVSEALVSILHTEKILSVMIETTKIQSKPIIHTIKQIKAAIRNQGSTSQILGLHKKLETQMIPISEKYISQEIHTRNKNTK